MTAVLEVSDLTTRFATPDGEVLAADDVGFAIGAGESLGVVGESGSGKTQIFLSIMGLLAKNGRSTGLGALSAARRSSTCRRAQLNEIRGDEIAMIFQDPMTSLNPFLKICAADDRGAARAQGYGRGARRASAGSPCSIWSASPRRRAGSTCIRTSSPAACASG